MRCYIAGRMRNVADLNRPAFAAAAQRLRSLGFDVYNPAAANLEGLPLSRIMSHVLVQLCECDAIYLIPGWWRSGGGRIEYLLARYLGLKRIHL